MEGINRNVRMMDTMTKAYTKNEYRHDMLASTPERLIKIRPPNWLDAPCSPNSLLRLPGSGAKSKIRDVDNGVMMPSPTPNRRRMSNSRRKSLTKPPATPNTRKRTMPVSNSLFLSMRTVRRADNSPIGIITKVGNVSTSLACVAEMPGKASRIAANAGETAVGAMMVNTDTDKMDGINILEYLLSSISFLCFLKRQEAMTDIGRSRQPIPFPNRKEDMSHCPPAHQ